MVVRLTFSSIPESTAASESYFSKAGWTINDRQTRLDAETVNSLMFKNPGQA